MKPGFPPIAEPTTTKRDVERLYRSHYNTLVRTAQQVLDTRHLAEEAVQEVFARLHASTPRPSKDCEVAFLRVCVRNQSRSMLRRRQVAERWRPEAPQFVQLVDEGTTARETERRVREECLRLSARQRDVLILRYWHGLSVGETAEHLSITAGSVKTYASRAREALRVRLVEQVA